MFHARLTARYAVRLEQAHLRPADAKPIADCIVDFLGGCDAILDQPQPLSPDCLKEAVSDMRVYFLSNDQRLHAEAAQQSSRFIHDCSRSPIAADNLYQWQ